MQLHGKKVDVLYVIGETTAYVFSNASFLSIFLMAWDRYIAVRYSLLHGIKMDCKRIFTVIILLWIHSIVFSTLRFMGVPKGVFYWVDLHVNYTLFGGILIGLYVSIYFTVKHQMAQSLRIRGYNSQTRIKPTHDEIEAIVKDVRANCLCASLLRTQLMSQRHFTSCTSARAKEEIYSPEGMVSVALTLLRINSLGWSVTLFFG